MYRPERLSPLLVWVNYHCICCALSSISVFTQTLSSEPDECKQLPSSYHNLDVQEIAQLSYFQNKMPAKTLKNVPPSLFPFLMTVLSFQMLGPKSLGSSLILFFLSLSKLLLLTIYKSLANGIGSRSVMYNVCVCVYMYEATVARYFQSCRVNLPSSTTQIFAVAFLLFFLLLSLCPCSHLCGQSDLKKM